MFPHMCSLLSHNDNNVTNSEEKKKSPDKSNDKQDDSIVKVLSDNSPSDAKNRPPASENKSTNAHSMDGSTLLRPIQQQTIISSSDDGEQPSTSGIKSSTSDHNTMPQNSDRLLFVRMACDKKTSIDTRKKTRQNNDPWVNRVGKKCITKGCQRRSKSRLKSEKIKCLSNKSDPKNSSPMITYGAQRIAKFRNANVNLMLKYAAIFLLITIFSLSYGRAIGHRIAKLVNRGECSGIPQLLVMAVRFIKLLMLSAIALALFMKRNSIRRIRK